MYARADDPDAVARLRDARTTEAPGTWFAPSPRRIIEALSPPARIDRRAIRRLAPGPVVFHLILPPSSSASQPAGVFDRDGVYAVRVSELSLLARVVEGARGPIVGYPLADLGVANDSAITPESIAPLQDATLAIDEGPIREGVEPTVVRLNASPSPEIVRVGAIGEKAIRERLRRRIVFVCTGNTCRSPMAEAIARSRVSKEAEPLETEILSAGLHAGEGSPATPQAIEALREMGYEMETHRSRALSLSQLAGADAIYTMTDTHLRGVLSMDPFAPAERLDVAGDIPDPIGGPLREYRECAARIKEAIEGRLKELDP